MANLKCYRCGKCDETVEHRNDRYVPLCPTCYVPAPPIGWGSQGKPSSSGLNGQGGGGGMSEMWVEVYDYEAGEEVRHIDVTPENAESTYGMTLRRWLGGSYIVKPHGIPEEIVNSAEDRLWKSLTR